MSCPFMLLKLYLDPLNFGRGYKRIYFLLGRTKQNIPEPHGYLPLVFLCSVSANQQRQLQCCFYQENMWLTWVCEMSSAFEKMGRKKVGVSIFFQKIWPLDDLLSHSSLLSVSFPALHHVKGQSAFPPPESIIRDGGGFSLTGRHCV